MNHTEESGGLSKSTAKKTRQRDNINKWAMQGEERCVSRRLLNIKETSLYIRLEVDTIYRMVSERRIPFVKVGRRTLFDVRLLHEWLEQHTVLPTSPKRLDDVVAYSLP